VAASIGVRRFAACGTALRDGERSADYCFVIKHGLYRRGRRLLGVVGGRCFVL